MDLYNQLLIQDATKRIHDLYYRRIKTQKLKLLGYTFEKDFLKKFGDVKKAAGSDSEKSEYLNSVNIKISNIASEHLNIIKDSNIKTLKQILNYFQRESYIFKFLFFIKIIEICKDSDLTNKNIRKLTNQESKILKDIALSTTM